MNVLIVNFSDIQGGAARAASRLHQSLLKAQIDSKMFVLEKNSGSFTVIGPSNNTQKIKAKIQSLINIWPLRKYNKTAPFSASFSPTFNISKRINSLNPDIVHLHWINAGMLRIEDLKKIKAPIVWSLHDMWAFTGGCHYADTCELYKSKCGTCEVLQSRKENDISRKIFNRKQKTYNQIPNLIVIGLSKWLETCAKSSTLFKTKEVINLPNPIDTNVFKKIDKATSRKLFNLPLNKKLILFGAMSATSDNRKGFKQLCDALHNLENKNIELMVFGSDKPQKDQGFGFKTHYLGQLKDDISLVALYSAADVTVVPSLQENLSNVIMESLSCSTPVVGFDIGGNSDLIDHKKNGYLASSFNTEDLAKGINWIINNENNNVISDNARAKAVQNFDYKIVPQQYINLYRSILAKNQTK